jgi:hypothetical protein
MQRPVIHPCAYNILILMLTASTTAAVFTLFPLLLYYCHCYKIVATDKPLQASLFPGAAELTTRLSRLIFILWLPLCQINKLGNTSLEDCFDPLYLWVIRRLYLLDTYWGDMGIPKLELFFIFHLITSFFSPYTWKLPYTKLHTIFISSISAIKMTNPFWFSSNISQRSIKTLATVTTYF